MPERIHSHFEADPEPPAKRVERNTPDKNASHGQPPERAATSTAPDPGLRRLGARKAPSQVARSNRRALEFKQKLAQDNNPVNPRIGSEDLPSRASSTTQAVPVSVQESRIAQGKVADGNLGSATSAPGSQSAVVEDGATGSRSIMGENATTEISSGNLKAKAASLQRVRQLLPIWQYAGQIRQSLQDRKILLLVGETGSGKSTQVPQFLLSEPWCRATTVMAPRGSIYSVNGQKQALDGLRKIRIGGCIAVTEPRRVAATTLARRVAEEMGTPLGKASPASTVGYSVRFDENTGPNTKIKFVTEGMLLQEMLHDPWLTRYSAVIVDEVHERGVNVDLLIGFLRRILTRSAGEGQDGRGGVPLRVVVMSATAEGSELVRFFEDGFGSEIAADDEMGQNVEEESEWSGLSDSEAMEELIQDDKIPASTEHVAALYFRGRQHPVKIHYTPRPVPDILEASMVQIFDINYSEPLPGDILVFLTGQKTVETLCALIEEYSATLSKLVPRLLALPLFAALPQEAQRRVFEPMPPHRKGQRGVRKVIVSTNIAETSVTVAGVRYVIDGGKEKVKQFRPRIGLDSLLAKPISQSSAIQRAGRAGREAPGSCYRLYTEPDFGRLEARALPEILRCDITQPVLALVAHGVPAQAVGSFPFLTVPPRDSLRAALVQLRQLGAVGDDGNVTEMGAVMAGLPVSASMGKALLKAAEPSMDCLDDMIDLVSAMSGEGIFLPTNDEDEDEAAQKSRPDDLWRRDGDHATMIMAVRGYAAEHGDRRKWAEVRGLSWRAMRGIMDIRKQLLALKARISLHTAPLVALEDAGLKFADLSLPISPNTLRCLLAGFPLSAAILTPDGSFRTISGRQAVAIHPSSVLFRRGKPAAIVYTEFVYTTRAYARGVSAVELDWILEALGGNWSIDDEG